MGKYKKEQRKIKNVKYSRGNTCCKRKKCVGYERVVKDHPIHAKKLGSHSTRSDVGLKLRLVNVKGSMREKPALDRKWPCAP